MFSSTFASRILKEAQTQGLADALPPEALEGPGKGASSLEAAYWGAHIASLVDSNALSKAELNSLAWDAIGREAGSWLDPFFKGPAPIGDLPGLGDRYRDLELVGEGATAKVYKALDTLLQRHVAIKVLKNPEGPTLVEARAQAQVEHPNVCRIYEAGKGFLVMQLVEGPTLALQAPSLNRDGIVRIVRDIALGIHAAHQKGLVHLDLKLNNVLLDKDEDGTLCPIVSDFGMVRGDLENAPTACPMGTPPYTSPEQLAGDLPRLGRGSDVYALGMMLYILLAGRIPFEAQDFPGLLDAMAHAPPVPLNKRVPDLPKDLAAIVHRCLAKQPEDRYPSARDLAADLEQFLRLGPVQAMGGTPLYRLGKWGRRNPMVLRLGAAGLVLLLSMAGLMIRHNRFVLQQSEWDHHFQKITEAIRTGIDQTYRLPMHNIEPELQKAQGYLRVIESDLAGGGLAAKGPGLLALAQAHYFLNPKDPQVVENLEEAWKSGYRVEGVRSWLALALVHRSRMLRRAGMLLERDRANAMKHETEAARRSIDQARSMLRGRWSPDQTRLAHLVELADAGARDPLDVDMPIRLAQEFLDRFPNDLDGMLEEAEAIASKADSLAYRAANLSIVYPPVCAEEVESLRLKSWRKLEHVQRIAPSHPAVYTEMARWWLRQVAYPTERTPSVESLRSQAGACLDEGRDVNPNDMALILLKTIFICSQEVPRYLERRMDPAPLAPELKDLFRRAGAVDPRQGRLNLLSAMASNSRGGWASGFSDHAPLAEALHEICSSPQGAGSVIPEAIAIQLGRNFLETGRDPGPILNELLVLERAGRKLEETSLIQRDLMLAEHAWLTGQDATPFLAAVPARLQKLDQNLRGYGSLELSYRQVDAKVRAEEPAWTRLAESIQRQGTSGHLDLKPHVLWAARTLLAQHLDGLGRTDPALVWDLRASLARPELRKEYPEFFLQYCSAPVLLLAARLEKDPRPLLREGLAACNASLATLESLGQNDQFHRPSERAVQPLVIPARLLHVKGELLLALAKLEKRPAPKVLLVRQAQTALQASLRHNPNLLRVLSPLMNDAKALATLKREIHARS